MRDRSLNPGVARGAQCNQVADVVGNIRKEVGTSPVYVVNVKGSAAGTAFCFADATALVALDHKITGLLPAPPVLEPFAASVVGVIAPDGPVLGAFVRAKAAASGDLTGKGSVRFSALLTIERLGGYEASISALPGAVSHRRIAGCECRPTDVARRNTGAGFLVAGVARLRTKSQIRVFLHLVPGARELDAAMPAVERGAVEHRLRMARLAAKDGGGVVGLKLFGTLGACLEQS
tara:strand:- start:268 stop:969 length:702 start_codon:yes stop_codon:yes gene_type:complete